MKSAVGKGWRNAASLVALSPRVSVARDPCNYEVLLQTRPQGGSFRNSVVFPGGVSEPADASAGWLRLLTSFGYSQSDFEALHHPGSHITPILQDNPVLRHIALRITAIRETFEELGLLICSRARKADRDSVRADHLSDFDVQLWQSRVSKDPEELFTLCKELKCYPDIWSLYYWSNWLSPTQLPKRFDTAFFLAALKSKPVIKGSREVVKVEWQTPSEVLTRSSELVLYPPQTYELSRLAACADAASLAAAARQRSGVVDPLYYHATVRATDGKLYVYAGDELYPSSIDYNKPTVIESDKSVLELRETSRTAHRYEFVDNKTRLVFKNFNPKNVDMGDQVIDVHMTVS
ncbi:acyl-coenzyme A diphosphatase NUDT19-like [Pectinophora gossypiella]|uniref:acyl-coenzyme A diphosphatase NUDT19-like n=1 Tax=Pectinophora gossypiella TaxID=13191 RepID=UPI00214F5824|nr:acyl-coenzyme A diphosphatase NUDT19-like [Pectinophora gossypiella]